VRGTQWRVGGNAIMCDFYVLDDLYANLVRFGDKLSGLEGEYANNGKPNAGYLIPRCRGPNIADHSL